MGQTLKKKKKSFGLQSSHNPLLSFLCNPFFAPACAILPFCLVQCRINLSPPLLCFTNHHTFSNALLNTTFHQQNSLDTSNSSTSSLKIYPVPKLPQTSQPLKEPVKLTLRQGVISDLYALLLAYPTTAPPTYVEKLERDLNLTLDTADWSQIWQATKSASPNIVTLDQLQVAYRMVPAREIPSQLLPKLLPRL